MNRRRFLVEPLLAAPARRRAQAAEQGRVVVDMADRRGALPTRIERIVTLGPLPVLDSFVFTMGEGARSVNGLADFFPERFASIDLADEARCFYRDFFGHTLSAAQLAEILGGTP